MHQFLFNTQVFSSFLASFKSSRCHFICYWDNVLFWNSTHQSEAPLHNHCLHMIGRNTKSKQTLSLNLVCEILFEKSEKWNSKRCFFSCEKRERGFVIIFYHRKVRLSYRNGFYPRKSFSYVKIFGVEDISPQIVLYDLTQCI